MNKKYRIYVAGLFMAASPCLLAATEPEQESETMVAEADTYAEMPHSHGSKAESSGKNNHHNGVAKKKINANLIPRGLPYMTLIGKDDKFYVGLGGAVKGTASIDFGHVLDNPNEFVVSAIPMQQSKGDGGLFQVSGQQTELYLTAGFNPGDKYEVAAYINGRFLGNNYGFQLENAYVSFLGFSAGYGYGMFCDTEAVPNTIDFEGPNAMLTVPSGMFNYRYTINKKWTVGAGIEMPMASFTTVPGLTRKVNQRIPDIPVMVSYTLPGGGHIGAAMLMRGLQYRDISADKNRTAFGWGVRLSGSGTLYGPLDFYFQGAYGKGMTSYIQDLNGMGMDMTPCGDDADRLSTVKSYALMGGLQYNFSKKVAATAAYSQVRAYPGKYLGGSTLWGEQYSYGQYAVGNVMWNITPIVQWGLEYIYGRRVNMDGSQAHDNRLQTMLQVSF